jgi:hypothetical protein
MQELGPRATARRITCKSTAVSPTPKQASGVSVGLTIAPCHSTAA